MDNLLLELVSFLRDPKLQVRQIAIENLLGQTKNDQVVTFLESNLPVGADLWHLALNDHPLVAHGAISILINLTSTPNSAFVTQTYTEDWVPRLASDICNEQFILADIAAMLLSNLTKYPEIARQLDGETLSGLVSIFVKGEGKTLNKLANYDFLANVFANVTSTMQGRRLMMETMLDGEALLASLLPFLQHSSLIRRGGVLSTIK
jgi:hypothetical protein